MSVYLASLHPSSRCLFLSSFLPSHVCLSSNLSQHQHPLSLSLSLPLSLSVLLSIFDSTHLFNPTSRPHVYLHALPTCIFLCGWWPQQALANVSSATSSSLQPLMMRKPLLRHWCRVCRQSNRLKTQTRLSCEPLRERQRTDRQIDWASLKLCTKTHCAPFLFCPEGFSLYA